MRAIVVVISMVMVAALGVLVDSTFSATAKPKCEGRSATIQGAGEIKGTSRADVIVGSNRNDLIRGGGGNDIICGRGGDDSLSGDQGNDIVRGGTGDDADLEGGPGRDDIGGGPGKDAVGYEPKDVRVTLDGQANDGRPGERDWVRGDVEGVQLGGGGTVIGNAGPNWVWMIDEPGTVYGEGGADEITTTGGRVYGGDGDDDIVKQEEASHTRIDGGPGNDHINGTDGYAPTEDFVPTSVRDWIACGSGSDTVIRGGLDLVRSDCERVRNGPR